MELTVGQTINVGGMEAKVTGMARLHTYTEYRLRSKAGKIFWLDDCGTGRLWRKADMKIDSFEINRILNLPAKNFFLFADSPLSILADSRLPNFVVKAVGCESVSENRGRVEGGKKGDKVFYIEGKCLPVEGFDLFIVEIWGDEPPEYSEGKAIDFFK